MILKGKSVTLSSELKASNAGELASAANSEDIHRLIGAHYFPYPYRVEHALEFINLNRSSGDEVFMEDFMIRHNGKLVGIIGLSEINWTDLSAHVGYWITGDYRNRGLATEALEIVCKYARRDLKLVRLHTKVMDINTASLRVLLKNGFKVEGYEQKSFYFEGVFHDMFCLAKLL